MKLKSFYTCCHVCISLGNWMGPFPSYATIRCDQWITNHQSHWASFRTLWDNAVLCVCVCSFVSMVPLPFYSWWWIGKKKLHYEKKIKIHNILACLDNHVCIVSFEFALCCNFILFFVCICSVISLSCEKLSINHFQTPTMLVS